MDLLSGYFTRFNSTLVQLKVREWKRLNKRQLSFNSTLVQLKVFLSGLWVLIQSSFNSTLVQLKGTPR